MNCNHLRTIIILITLCMLFGCVATKHHNEKESFHAEKVSNIVQGQTPLKPISHMIMPQNKPSGLQSEEIKNKDVIVRLCKPLTVEELNEMMLDFQLVIQKKLSPILMTVIWHDERLAEAVISQLNVSGKFCGVEKNQKMYIMRE